MNVILPPGSYYGDRRRAQQLPALRLTENAYSPAFVIPRHAHQSAFFGLVIEGGYRENYDTRSRECTPDTLLFHPAGELHSERHHDVVVRIFSIEPGGRLLQRVREYSGALDGPRAIRGGAPVRLAARLYAEFWTGDPIASLAMEGLSLELLVGACRRPETAADRTPPAWLRKARDLLNDRCAENLGLEDIGREVGVHPAHLARTFRRHFHCTAGDYQRQVRVGRARQLLATSDTPLVEIALALGYADQSHFTAAFKRHTGATPSAFRRAARAQSRRDAQL
jgi:AraC family transcriptional regulator